MTTRPYQAQKEIMIMASFILEELDNKSSAGQAFVGKVFSFNYDGFRFYFGSLYSSFVYKIENTEETMVVTTKNSIYTFRRKM